MQLTSAAHTGHDFVEDQLRAVSVAHLPDRLEVARHGIDAACRGADHRLGAEGRDGFREEPLKLRVQFVG